MAAPASAEEFLDLVRKSSVVDEKRLDTYVQGLRASNTFPDEPGKMAGLMVRDGLLTHFQAEQFLLGKWRRFTIGKYKVLERLGSGGMGSVYLCEHKFMRRRVAVKVLPAAKAEDPASLERFYREARAAAALDHPNIVRAYDIDQDENLHFLVMEYVDGASLQEIIKRSGPMNMLRAAHYTRQAAIGMQHAHEAGLVHRDIKPGNVLVDRSGTVKVLDMGLARFFHDEEDILTKKYDESVLGTADYLAPEQALDSHGVDIRADIYSLGATFYFCLTGQPPFNEGTVAQKLIWHQTRQPKPIRQLRPEVPEQLAAIINKMMEKDRLKRYQTPSQVSESLAPLTTRPIPPPPDIEMPRLSPAAMSPMGSEQSVMLQPSQNPLLQQQQQPPSRPPSAAPAATPAPAVRPAAAQQQVAAVHAPAAPRPAQPMAAPPPTPDPRRVATPPPRPQARPTIPNNGTFAPTATPAAHSGDEVSPNWGDLTSGPASVPRAQVPQRTAIKQSQSQGPTPQQRFQTILEDVKKRPKFWMIAGISVFLILIVLVIILAMAFRGGKPGKADGSPAHLRVASVSATPGKGNYRTVRDALLKAEPGDRIVVLDESHAEYLDFSKLPRPVKDISIESDPGSGKRVVWRPPPPGTEGSPPQPPTHLLALSHCPGLTLKGFHFIGQAPSTQIRDVLTVFGRCPGLKLEDLAIEGFSNSAVKLVNATGEPGRPILLNGLRAFAPAANTQAALEVYVSRGYPGLTTLEHVRVENCRFEGPYRGAVTLAADATCDIGAIELIRNRFWNPRGGDAILYRKQTGKPLPGLRLTIDSNTFCDVQAGLHLESLPMDDKGPIALQNNLFIRTSALATLDLDPAERGPSDSPAHWIWYDEGNPAVAAPAGNVWFRKGFAVPKVQGIVNARLDLACDDACTVWINGTQVKDTVRGNNRVATVDVTSLLRSSDKTDTPNVIAVQGTNTGGPAALLVQMSCVFMGNPTRQVLVFTNNQWKAYRGEPAPSWNALDFAENDQWKPAKELARYGQGFAKDLVWDSWVADHLARVTAKVFSAGGANVRDAASKEGNIPVRSTIVDGTVGTNPDDDATFLRYPKSSPFTTAGTGNGPVGVPPGS